VLEFYLLEQSMGARNRVGIGLSYGPAITEKLQNLNVLRPEPVFVNVQEAQELMPTNRFCQAWNRFFGSFEGLQIRLWTRERNPINSSKMEVTVAGLQDSKYCCSISTGNNRNR
jgi:hypothetical protein